MIPLGFSVEVCFSSASLAEVVSFSESFPGYEESTFEVEAFALDTGEDWGEGFFRICFEMDVGGNEVPSAVAF